MTFSFKKNCSFSPEVFHQCESMLGEGVIWHEARASIFWLDISEKRLFERKLSRGLSRVRSWSLVNTATALATVHGADSQIWMLTEIGLVLFNLDTGEQQPLGTFALPDGFRTNDGGPGPLGRFWFGSMQHSPQEGTGKIFSVGSDGDYRVEVAKIGIPNTFAAHSQKESIYISDSLLQKTNSYNFIAETNCKFLDFSDQLCTPDGGAIDSSGNLWIALWDGYSVNCYSPSGKELTAISLPAPRPTSCCFGGKDFRTLFITSAREGLSEKTLNKYPLSGSVFSVELGVKGARVSGLFEPV